MNLTDSTALAALDAPVEMPVSELLTGDFHFSIPSYQRGYRWESSDGPGQERDGKQVDDMLDDLISFVSNRSRRDLNYYLQPLMVKPVKSADGTIIWDVLDGQQRLTTILLVLQCINEKLYQRDQRLPLYTLTYQNRPLIDFRKITYDTSSHDYDYPDPSENLDSYYVRKAKDRIGQWYDSEVAGNQELQDRLKEMLFYPDSSRGDKSNPTLRAKFIWYNSEPLSQTAPASQEGRMSDIEAFNRLNRGKISLTDSELIKALFLISLKDIPSSGSSLMKPETLVRKWDEMGKKFQNDSFWKMISPKNREYGNRMDLLFDFIIGCKRCNERSSYRFFYREIHSRLNDPDGLPAVIESLWNDIKRYFDTLCKWHEDVHRHNLIGYLVENGRAVADIHNALKDASLEQLVKETLGYNDVSDIDELSYHDSAGFIKIRKTLLLFNVLTCDRFGQKFPFDKYRDELYDVEHVNSQTDHPIEKTDDKREWIRNHALPCLWEDRLETGPDGHFTASATQARALIAEGISLMRDFDKNNNRDIGEKFRPYRIKVENFYASGDCATSMNDKDAIGNLTLLNSTINREYKNALFPRKLRTLKRSDQEGRYIPLCTKYMFLKYYSNPSGNASAFSMMRWREADQRDYTEAIKETIGRIF